MRIEGIKTEELKTSFCSKIIQLRNEMLTFNISQADLVLAHDTGNHQYLILASLVLEDKTVRIWLNSKALETFMDKAWICQIKAILAKTRHYDKFKACLSKYIKSDNIINQITTELLKAID